MEVVLSKYCGFCFGVKRATDIVYKTLSESNIPTYALGEIIHNSFETKKMISRGLKFISTPQEISSKSNLIIGAFGISSFLKNKIPEKVNIIDTTCPYVKKIFNLVKKLKEEKYQIIIVGNKEHIEVKNILSHINNDAIVIDNLKELKKINVKNKVGVVSQTTQDILNFKKVINKLLSISKEIKIFNTICDETIKRQTHAKVIAKKVDVMLIVGGKHSENTKNLYEICKTKNKRTYHIEDEKDITPDIFYNAKKVGITSGASTPQEIIERVIKKLKKLGNSNLDTYKKQ